MHNRLRAPMACLAAAMRAKLGPVPPKDLRALQEVARRDLNDAAPLRRAVDQFVRVAGRGGPDAARIEAACALFHAVEIHAQPDPVDMHRSDLHG